MAKNIKTRASTSEGKGKALKSPISKKNVLSNNLDICPSCDNSVKKGEKGVSCDECQQWWHAKCSKFSDEQYTWLEENISIRFLCKECTKKPKSSAKGEVSNSEILSQMKEMMADMSKLLKSHLQITEENVNLTKRVEKLEAVLNEKQNTKVSVQDNEEKIRVMVADRVGEVVTEAKEKEDRKLNLIIVNVPENSDEGDPIKSAKRLFKKVIPDDVKIEEAVRLGKSTDNVHPRLIKVRVGTLESKRKIMGKASRVNEGTGITDPKKKIYINNDYTISERKVNKELREKLLEMEPSDRNKYTVRDFKIVLREKPDNTSGGSRMEN